MKASDELRGIATAVDELEAELGLELDFRMLVLRPRDGSPDLVFSGTDLTMERIVRRHLM